jgi:cytoskeletal protein CcmA (bactofilin family)
MFKKKELQPQQEEIKRTAPEPEKVNYISKHKINTLLRGSKLTGDINVSYDLEISGEVEGNINADKNSNIAIKGLCKGNISTMEGNVIIEGELSCGDIVSGGNVKITGKFNGGKITAKGSIYINGEFNGRLEGSEIEVGANSIGKGELFYKEYISVAKGAKVEVQISHVKDEVKAEKKEKDAKPENVKDDVKVVLDLPKEEAGEIIVH